jgi:hypothetical protein
MAFAVDHSDYRFVEEVDLLFVLDRLAGMGDLTAEGSLGVRFAPARLGWPATYFHADGRVHVVAEGMDLEELSSYVLELSALLGAEIVEEGHRH